ncbi:MAG: hypothetical protein CVV42_02535 [Candidatus Riflebacteria bacterium HGW-Riflebacteria-2]|jgi:hypothetical protein|nr:MAG: hypothetical protein CVV42_02535 [Candidatus Riflebacteria bacterium HGW-Riflebacteria-2]
MLFAAKKHQNQGSVLLLAIFIAISLTIFSLSYFRMMRAARNTDHRLGQQFVARETALMLREEAMAIIQRDCRDRRSQIFWFLLGAVAGAEMEMRLPFASDYISKLLQPGFSCEVSSRLKVVNFINYDHRSRYYASGKEGHGILAVHIEVTLLDERGGGKATVIKESLHSQYDYLVASMLSLDSRGSRLLRPLTLRHDRQTFDSYSSLQIEDYEESPVPEEDPAKIELYDRITLWRARNLRVNDLEQMLIIDRERKILNLYGICHCADQIELAGDWQIKGKGVLIADSFNIAGALKKSGNEDMLVLYARKGKITVDTSEKIEAALIAINDKHNGTVESRQALNLSGMLLADYLNLDNWSNNTHRVSFDKALLDADKSYQISVSPWTNFRSGARN